MIWQKYILLLALSSLLFGVAGFWAGTNYSAQSAIGSRKSSNKTGQLLRVGDRATINGIELTLNGVTSKPTDDEFTYIVVELSITNQKDYIHEFTLHKLTLVDHEGFAYEYDHQYETKGVLGGQIAPGRTVRGEVAFWVPINENYEFVYTDHLRTGQVIWYVDSSKMKIVKKEKD